ncbi:MAG TPA: hypothetical protein VHC92_02765 [Rhodanobacteraceae bacterium]|jgi:hypothetical protein|nr:hypothetical protein [Rhodanobacteraceae bacterium]
MASRTLVVLLGGLLAPLAAGAANLVENPDFSNGLDGWTLASESGTVEIDADNGLPDAPSLHVLGESFDTSVAAQSTCIEIDGGAHVDLHALVLPRSGMTTVLVQPYADTTCETPLDPVSTEAIGANSEWQELSLLDAALPDGTAAARVVLSASLGSMGSVGDASFDHVAFGPTGSVPYGVDISQEGLTNAWYNPATSGQGFQVVVSPGNTSYLFAAWYTFGSTAGGTDTQRWYTFDSAIQPGATTAAVTIYRNTGGNFLAPPITNAVAVGSGTLTFYSCTSGLFTYAFDDGPSGSIPLLALMPNVECAETSPATTVPPPPLSAYGFSGTWFDPATGGQGFIINVNPVDVQTFVGWYTYAIDGESVGEAGQRWFTAQGPHSTGSSTPDELTIYESTGGTFDASDPVTTTPVGTASLMFESCTSASLEYNFTAGEMSGKSGTIALTRLGAPPISCDASE